MDHDVATRHDAGRAVLVPPRWWRGVGLLLGAAWVALCAQPLLLGLTVPGGVVGAPVDGRPSVRQLLGPAQVAGVASYDGTQAHGPVAPCSFVPVGAFVDARASAGVRIDLPDGTVLEESVFVDPAAAAATAALDPSCEAVATLDGGVDRVQAVPGGWTRSSASGGRWQAVQVRRDGDRLVLVSAVSEAGPVEVAELRRRADLAVEQLEARDRRAAGTVWERSWVALLLLAAVAVPMAAARLLRRRWRTAWALWLVVHVLPLTVALVPLYQAIGRWSYLVALPPVALAVLLAGFRALVGRAVAEGTFGADPAGGAPPDVPDDERLDRLRVAEAELGELGFRPVTPPLEQPGGRLAQCFVHAREPVVATMRSYGGLGPHRDLSLVTPVDGLAATVATSTANDLPAFLAGVEQAHPSAGTPELWARHGALLEELARRGVRFVTEATIDDLAARERTRTVAVRRAPLAAAAWVMWWQLVGRGRERWQPSRPRELAVRALLRGGRRAPVGGAR